MSRDKMELILNNVLLALQLSLGLWQFMKLTPVGAVIQGLIGWLLRPWGFSPNYSLAQHYPGRVFKRANCFALQADIPYDRIDIVSPEVHSIDLQADIPSDRFDIVSPEGHSIELHYMDRDFLLERTGVDRNMLIINKKMCYYITDTIWEKLQNLKMVLNYSLDGPPIARVAVAHSAVVRRLDALTAGEDAAAEAAADAADAVAADAATNEILLSGFDFASTAQVEAEAAAADAEADAAKAKARADAAAARAAVAKVRADAAAARADDAAAYDKAAAAAAYADEARAAAAEAIAFAAAEVRAYKAAAARAAASAEARASVAEARAAAAAAARTTIVTEVTAAAGAEARATEAAEAASRLKTVFVKGNKPFWAGIITGGVMTLEEVFDALILYNQHVGGCLTINWLLPVNLSVSEEKLPKILNLVALLLQTMGVVKVLWFIPTLLSLTSALLEFGTRRKEWLYTRINVFFFYMMHFISDKLPLSWRRQVWSLGKWVKISTPSNDIQLKLVRGNISAIIAEGAKVDKVPKVDKKGKIRCNMCSSITKGANVNNKPAILVPFSDISFNPSFGVIEKQFLCGSIEKQPIMISCIYVIEHQLCEISAPEISVFFVKCQNEDHFRRIITLVSSIAKNSCGSLISYDPNNNKVRVRGFEESITSYVNSGLPSIYELELMNVVVA